MSSVATSADESNKVNRVVYVDDETADWKEIPSDGRLSATDEIILYYYGEYAETTQVITTQSSSETETPDVDTGSDTTETTV